MPASCLSMIATRALPLLLLVASLWAAASTEEVLARPLAIDEQQDVVASTGIGDGAAMGSAVSSVIGGTLTVIAILVVLAWAMRRFGGRLPRLVAGEHLELVEHLPLGVKRSVALLRCGSRMVLIGQSEQGLHALGQFTDRGLCKPTTEGVEEKATGQAMAEAASPALPDGDAVSAFKARLQAVQRSEA